MTSMLLSLHMMLKFTFNYSISMVHHLALYLILRKLESLLPLATQALLTVSSPADTCSITSSILLYRRRSPNSHEIRTDHLWRSQTVSESLAFQLVLISSALTSSWRLWKKQQPTARASAMAWKTIKPFSSFSEHAPSTSWHTSFLPTISSQIMTTFIWLDWVGKWSLPLFHYYEIKDMLSSLMTKTAVLYHAYLISITGTSSGWTRLITPIYISGPYFHAHLQEMHSICIRWCLDWPHSTSCPVTRQHHLLL